MTLWQTDTVEFQDSVGTVAVIGLGTMGTGIAEVVARHGFAPAPRLEHLVTAGYTGRKAGRGFRSYA